MINEYPEKYYSLNLDINIKNVVEGSVASKLSGFFFISDIRFLFTALAFGRIGGHNVNLKISKTSHNQIKKLGYDPEIILQMVQRKIIEGEITILDPRKKEDI
jgi:hypothetical protein